MPLIKPFKGFLYDKTKIKNISRVVAPPYDVISAKQQSALYTSSPWNVVRLILGKMHSSDDKSDNRYTRAGRSIESWINEGVLKQDDKDAIYVYLQRYNVNGKSIDRIGFIALIEIETGDKDRILPHENTLAAPKADRLNLIRCVKANLSPIFFLYNDDDHAVVKEIKRRCAKERPVFNFSYDGSRHIIWKIQDPELVKKINGRMVNSDIFIADGHHRYEVAKNYYREISGSSATKSFKDNARFVMAYFVESTEEMLTILPTHRVVKSLSGISVEEILKRLSSSFRINKFGGMHGLLNYMKRARGKCVIGAYFGRKTFYSFTLTDRARSDAAIKGKPKEWKRLDVSVLHPFVLEHLLGVADDEDNIEYVKDPLAGKKMVDSGKFKAAFFLNSTKVSQVKAVARIGERMPRKATYFYPKPLSGLVINRF